MIKLVFCVRRREDVSEEEFHRYWLEVHGPLVRERAEAMGVRRYVQVHRVATPVNDAIRASRGADEPYDGVAELWWDDLESLVAAGGTDAARKAGQELLEDERRFVDLARSTLWFGEEHVIVG